MPAEPMTVYVIPCSFNCQNDANLTTPNSLLRPRNFFTQNPCLDVPPSYSSTPSQVAAGKTGIRGVVDSLSRLAFGSREKGGSDDCGCK